MMFIRIFILAICTLLHAALALAEPGPGIPNVNYPASKVGDMISDDNGYQETTALGVAPPGVICSDLGRTALVGIHRGYVFAGYEGPGSAANSRRGQCIVDLSNPASPKILQWSKNTAAGQESHGYAKRGKEIHIGGRYSIDDAGVITEAPNLFYFDDYGAVGRGGMFAGWNMTFMWNYRPVSGLHSLGEKEGPGRTSTTHASFDMIGETGIGGGYPYILGNLLIYASDQADNGVVTYDISDPKNPVLLDVLNGGAGIGGYWVEIWKNYLIFPRRKRSQTDPTKRGVVHVVDFADPTDLKYVAEIPVDGDPMYGQMQDHYAFVDGAKIDLSPLDVGGTPTVVVNFDEKSRNVDQSQFVLPVGNLLLAGGIAGGPTKWQGLTAWVHQAAKDTQCPEVAYHYPKNGEKDYPTTAPLAIMIHETLETANLELGRTFLVREVATSAPVNGRWLFPMYDVLTFNPYTNFKPGTDYEVIFTEDAFTDAVGNKICDTTGPGDGIAYRFTFTTANGSNPRPHISTFSMNKASPLTVGDQVSFNIAGSDNNNIEYRLNYGDGDEANRSRTAWISANGKTVSASLSHRYLRAGNFKAMLQVREKGTLTRLSSRVIPFVVQEVHVGPKPTQSGQMALDETRRSLWVVNPDNNSVAILDADSNLLQKEVSVGVHPISVAIDSSGRAWIACRDSDQIYVLNANGTINKSIQLDYGARPVSTVFSPDGSEGFAALEGTGKIAKLEPSSISVSGELSEQNGVNYELYDVLSSNTIPGVNSIADVSADKFTRRFYGIHTHVTDSLRIRFDDEFPRASVGKRGVSKSFALVYRAQLEVPQTGSYKIHLKIKGASTARLKLGDVGEIAVPSGGTALRTDFISANLSKGRHPITVTYLNNTGVHHPHFLELDWEGPGITLQKIPVSAYYPEQDTRKPRALAISPDSSKLLISQFISDDNSGKIFVYDLVTDAWDPTVLLLSDEKSFDTGSFSRGVPNYVQALSISPDGKYAWYGAKKDNIFTTSPTFQTTVRAVVGPVEIGKTIEPRDGFGRSMVVDIDNHSLPSYISYDPTGTKLLVTMQMNNELIVLDADTRKEIERVQVGLSPTAAIADSATRKIFVKNFLNRNVTVFDGSRLIDNSTRDLAASVLATVSTVGIERLSPQVLRGKQVFYSARDLDDHTANPSRMSLDGYLSCASCHLDGGDDGRTFKRLALGEGFRNTISLRGASGLGHGNLHWSANFDELQDFELDMVNAFGGRGFTPTGPNPSIGAPNAGRNTDLDALAAYVSSLDARSIPRSPYRSPSAASTALGNQGKALFKTAGCETCHLPNKDYTDSTLGGSPKLHDIGTLKPTSGNRLGSALTGIDTPSLLGVHATAPYLHDGSAPTIPSIFEQYDSSGAPGSAKRAHDLSALSAQERKAIYQFLLELDGGVLNGPRPPSRLRLR